MTVEHDRTGCYLRPPFLETPLVPSRFMAASRAEILRVYSQFASQDARPSGPNPWKVSAHVGYNLESITALPLEKRRPGHPTQLAAASRAEILPGFRDLVFEDVGFEDLAC